MDKFRLSIGQANEIRQCDRLKCFKTSCHDVYAEFISQIKCDCFGKAFDSLSYSRTTSSCNGHHLSLTDIVNKLQDNSAYSSHEADHVDIISLSDQQSNHMYSSRNIIELQLNLHDEIEESILLSTLRLLNNEEEENHQQQQQSQSQQQKQSNSTLSIYTTSTNDDNNNDGSDDDDDRKNDIYFNQLLHTCVDISSYFIIHFRLAKLYYRLVYRLSNWLVIFNRDVLSDIGDDNVVNSNDSNIGDDNTMKSNDSNKCDDKAMKSNDDNKCDDKMVNSSDSNKFDDKAMNNNDSNKCDEKMMKSDESNNIGDDNTISSSINSVNNHHNCFSNTEEALMIDEDTNINTNTKQSINHSHKLCDNENCNDILTSYDHSHNVHGYRNTMKFSYFLLHHKHNIISSNKSSNKSNNNDSNSVINYIIIQLMGYVENMSGYANVIFDIIHNNGKRNISSEIKPDIADFNCNNTEFSCNNTEFNCKNAKFNCNNAEFKCYIAHSNDKNNASSLNCINVRCGNCKDENNIVIFNEVYILSYLPEYRRMLLNLNTLFPTLNNSKNTPLLKDTIQSLPPHQTILHHHHTNNNTNQKIRYSKKFLKLKLYELRSLGILDECPKSLLCFNNYTKSVAVSVSSSSSSSKNKKTGGSLAREKRNELRKQEFSVINNIDKL